MTQEKFDAMVLKDANSSSGSEKYYDCPKCLNRGWTYAYHNGIMVSVQCDCLEIRKTNRMLYESGLAETIKTNTFESYIVTESWQKGIKERCLEFVNNFQLGMSITMLGQSGSGKTHLCTAICGKLINMGYPLKYVLWRDIVTKLQANIFNDQGYTQITDELRKVDVLYLDDMFKLISSNPAQKVKELELAFKIINDRAISCKSTIISSEMMLNELSKLDEAIVGRIVKMSTPHYTIQISKAIEKNYRLKDVGLF
jgi:DNA replication protein DnaC